MATDLLFSGTPYTERVEQESSDKWTVSSTYTGSAETELPEWVAIHHSEIEATGGVRGDAAFNTLVRKATSHVEAVSLLPVDEDATREFDRLVADALDEAPEELI